MKFLKPFLFFLNSAVDTAHLSHILPTGFQLRHAIDEMVNVWMLDTFDHPLQRSGRLLAHSQNKVLLFTPNTPSILTQLCPVTWRFPDDLAHGKVKDALSQISPLRAFLRTGSRHLQISRFSLLDDEEKTLARAHLYTFERDSQTSTLGATQPLQGYAKGHRLLVEAFMEQGAQIRKKDFDVYSFLGFDCRIYCSKPGIAMKPEDPMNEATRRIIATFLQVARKNEQGIQADHDTEFLHDYRVSLRKVRSVLSLCKGVYAEDDAVRLKQTFADIMKQTNRLRDLDVYLLEQDCYFSMIPESMHKGLRVMFELFAQERQQQLKCVVEMLQSETYHQTISDLIEQFQRPDALKPGRKGNEPTLSFASRLIWKRYKKVCQIARHITADTPDEEVHCLRIQCKKLRYLMEFFTPLFSQKRIKTLIKALKRLQDNLGRFNDFSVQQDWLQRFLQDQSAQQQHNVRLAESIGALITVLHQRQLAERQQVMENIAYFDSARTRTTFRNLFTSETA